MSSLSQNPEIPFPQNVVCNHKHVITASEIGIINPSYHENALNHDL